MDQEQAAGPESTAVRVALWRAMHVLVDTPPHVLTDEIGLQLVAPDGDWRARPDMDPASTSGFRAAVISRARFIEDLVTDWLAAQGGGAVGQYVLLGAGLDTFAQRRTDLASRLKIFEVDQPGPQAWKRRRLAELGFGIPDWLRLVPVDFEVSESWWQQLAAAGFDATRPAIVACTGVTMYLTKAAVALTLRQLAGLAPGSTLAMTFLLPSELVDDADRSGLQASQQGARTSGTPFVNFYTPDEMLALAREAGFNDVQHVPGKVLAERYFADRTDGLRPSSGEDFVLAAM
jgi:methyltransferase (TIGR00027 family)